MRALGLLVATLLMLGGDAGASRRVVALDAAGLLAAIDHIRSAQPFTGSVLVVKDGRTFAARSYGDADRARRHNATVGTRYRISDLTVVFTWIGLLQLRDGHRLDLDRSVCAYFPGCPRAWRPLTPRHLMGVSSGLKPLPPRAFARPPTLAEYADRLSRERLFFEPGTILAHNASRFFGGASPDVLAGRLLEVVSGEGWSAYVRRHILRPAGMTATGFERSSRDATGYGRDRSRRVVPRPLPANTVVPPVDLGLWSTVLDFARLDRALRAGRLLSDESLAELDTPLTETDRRRGRGPSCCWIVTKQFGHAAEVTGGHGSGDGFYAVLERYPADEAAVFVFTNLGGNGPAFAVADLAASVALGEYPTGVDVDPAALRQLAGVFEYRNRVGTRTFAGRLTITVEQRMLRVTKATGFAELLGLLVATSESTFVGRYAPAFQLEFSRAADGTANGFTLRNVNAGWRADFRRVGR